MVPKTDDEKIIFVGDVYHTYGPVVRAAAAVAAQGAESELTGIIVVGKLLEFHVEMGAGRVWRRATPRQHAAERAEHI